MQGHPSQSWGSEDDSPQRAGCSPRRPRRLAWEAPDPLVRSEPVKRTWDAEAWAKVCPATDYGTSQLMEQVGTPEEPLFTYEEAVHHRRGHNDLELHVGADIPTEERDHLSRAFATTLENRRKPWKPTVSPSYLVGSASRMGCLGTTMGPNGLPC